MKLSPQKDILVLAIVFTEGGAVMAAELFAGMLVAPFFGTSLISWALVLSITLAGLALGYFLGGQFSKKFRPKTALVVILLLGGLCLGMMPLLAQKIMPLFIDYSLELGLSFSLMLILMPALTCFGCVGPLAVAYLTEQGQMAGEKTGSVYAISTLGGIVTTLVLGLQIIPLFGILVPAVVVGALVMLSALLLATKRVFKWQMGALAVYVIFGLSQIKKEKSKPALNGPLKQLHHSEGILGQVKVIDFAWKEGKNNSVMTARALTVNNTWQTAVNRANGVSILNYVYHIMPVVLSYPKNASILVVGLGGGGLVAEMQRLGYKPEVVELDARLPQLAQQYFGMHNADKVIVDDGRHFINTCSKKYDLIVLDVFQGEMAPWQLLTLECFSKIKTMLKPKGSLLIEFFGNPADKNLALNSVIKTLEEAFFVAQVVQVESRENLIVASVKGKELKSMSYAGQNYVPKSLASLAQYEFDLPPSALKEAIVLTDDLPVLEKLSSAASRKWRNYQNSIFRDNLLKQQIQIVN